MEKRVRAAGRDTSVGASAGIAAEGIRPAISLSWGRPVAVALLAGTLVGPARADDLRVRAWAAACATCHGTAGKSLGGIPSLAGRPADELYRLLLAFKSGERKATVMHQHAKGYSDDELKRIAAHFAGERP